MRSDRGDMAIARTSTLVRQRPQLPDDLIDVIDFHSMIIEEGFVERVVIDIQV